MQALIELLDITVVSIAQAVYVGIALQVRCCRFVLRDICLNARESRW